MSVLKYNNNGTWEGLNIDHASTADSALYDADGNVISSTYLPRSAGSTKPLTDDLYVYKENGSSGVYGYFDGTLRSYHGALGNSAVMAAYDANGDVSGRITIDQGNGYVTIAGNGLGHILFRPNGYNSTTGQVYIDTDGQFHNGVTRDGTTFASKSVPAGGTVTAVANHKVPKTGVYLVQVYCDYNPSTSGSGMVFFGVGYNSATSRANINTCPMYGGSHVCTTLTAWAYLAANDYVYFNVAAPTAGVCGGAIYTIQIA